jgi:photosystem II stability/assembly factor-like uncharacterized protein
MLDSQRPASSDRPGTRRRAHTTLTLVLALVAATAVSLVVVLSTSAHYYSTTASLNAVAYPDNSHGWVVGDIWQNGGLSITGGTIRATRNGGATWKQQKSGTIWEDPGAVAFANARCGWVVGCAVLDINGKPEGGGVNALFATIDGGATWKRQISGTKYLITAIACANATRAWAIGADYAHNGIILATTNGGARWKKQMVTTTENFNGVAFADAEHGWVVGDDGIIFATIDGGATWKKQRPITGYVLSHVACAKPNDAWVVGSDDAGRSVILATTDGGATWKVQHSSKGVNLSGIAFADATHGWVVGFGGLILATTDGGKGWKPQRSGTKTDLRGVAFADAAHGLAVGYATEGDDPLAAKLVGSTILRTSDGGANWKH